MAVGLQGQKRCIWDFLPADMGYGGEDPNDDPDFDAIVRKYFTKAAPENSISGRSSVLDSLPPDMGHGGEDPND